MRDTLDHNLSKNRQAFRFVFGKVLNNMRERKTAWKRVIPIYYTPWVYKCFLNERLGWLVYKIQHLPVHISFTSHGFVGKCGSSMRVAGIFFF